VQLMRPFVKRTIDVVGAALGLLAGVPVFALVALLIRLTMGPPVFFRQRRGGLRGAVFSIYKFRTMSDARDASGALLPDNRRLTRLGRVLRRTSIDEFPQLWNVVKGDMSLVGPRPLVAEYLERYNSFQRRRHEVRPGLTGLAQIQGRNAVDWNRRFELDVWYVDHCSLWLDAKILAATFWKLLGRASSDKEFAPIPEFRGSE
jgi:sugar transferase EpsL